MLRFRYKVFLSLALIVSLLINTSQFALAQQAGKIVETDSIRIDKSFLKVEKVPVDKIEGFRQKTAFQYGHEKAEGFNIWSYFWYYFSKVLEAIFADKGAAPYLRILFVLLVLGFVIYKIFGANISGIFSFNKKLKSNGGFDYFDEDIHSQDLDKNLRKALAEQNYRDAIRYYYLKLLKGLDMKGLISWEISKTNQDYQRELTKQNLLDSFIALSGIYEYTWYGNFKVNTDHFNNWQNDFQAAIRKVTNTNSI
jgi:hypothetical protein